MRLPNGEQAVVEGRKVRDYVLSTAHPTGRHHASLFRDLLGIDRTNAELLKTALLAAARSEPVTRQVRTPHGAKFEMSVDVHGPRGTKRVRAVWIIEDGKPFPRLVTCYVE